LGLEVLERGLREFLELSLLCAEGVDALCIKTDVFDTNFVSFLRKLLVKLSDNTFKLSIILGEDVDFV
jgi:hypothetical protein